MISIRKVALVAAMLLAAACTKQQTAPAAAAEPVKAPPSAEQILGMTVRTVAATPTPVHRSSPATFRATFNGAIAGAPLTLSWFGPDGWLVYDQMGEVHGDGASFALSPSAFPGPGRYHYDLHSGVVLLGTGDVDVLD